jgi:uracil-DNA glycosylase
VNEPDHQRCKERRYARLVAARKQCRSCIDLVNPAAIEGGRLDSAHVGPWSRWQGNLYADLMVVGQDWGDVQYLLANGGRDGEHNPTNRKLEELLASVGVHTGAPGQPAGQYEAFFTNAILCLKQGGLQARVKRDWFENCTSHLREQVETVGARVVVGLGELAFGSVLRAFGLRPHRFRTEVEDPIGRSLPTGGRAFAVYHCGRRILNTHRPMEAQLRDWRRIESVLATGRP